MSYGRHALHLTDEKLAIFHAESGSDVRLDVPLVNVIHESHDVQWLWQDLDQTEDLRLIVIDPLSDFCPTPGLLTETLHRLNDLAANCNIAIVVTLRATGRYDSRGRLEVKSRWTTDAARCAWFVALDPEDDARRLFVPTRTNFCVEPQGLGFWIESGRVVWDAAAKIDFQDPLENLSGAALWLSQLLAEGDVPAKLIYSLGAECGYTPDMLKYAKKKIGALKKRIGGREDAHWQWSLQAVEANLNNSSAGNLTVANQDDESVAAASDQTGSDQTGPDQTGPVPVETVQIEPAMATAIKTAGVPEATQATA